MYLNGRDINQSTVIEIVGNFIDQRKYQLRLLQEYLSRFKDIYQYVYSHVFPEVYTASKKRGFNLKSNFHILFKAYRDKQLIWQQTIGKNPKNFDQRELNEFDQKPIINFDSFSTKEENEIKVKAEKRLADPQEKAHKLKKEREKKWNWKNTLKKKI